MKGIENMESLKSSPKRIMTGLLLVAGIIGLISCSEGELGPIAIADPEPAVITSPQNGQIFVLTQEQASDTLMIIKWDAPGYGFSAAATYTIEMDQSGSGFSSPIQLGVVNTTSYPVIFEEMNLELLGAGIDPLQEASFDIRVRAFVTDSLGEQVSDPITLSFIPYSACRFCPEIYLPGGYQEASGYGGNWSPATAPAIGADSDNDTYEGYVYFAEDNSEFKVTGNRNWDDNWGTPNNGGALEAGGEGNNIRIPNAGYFKVNVDVGGLGYFVTRTEWGAIGTALPTGWDSDQDMTFNTDDKTWSITTDLINGPIKFRANDSWNINYGPANSDEMQGTLIKTDASITIPEDGNYTVVIDLNGVEYTYTVTKN